MAIGAVSKQVSGVDFVGYAGTSLVGWDSKYSDWADIDWSKYDKVLIELGTNNGFEEYQYLNLVNTIKSKTGGAQIYALGNPYPNQPNTGSGLSVENVAERNRTLRNMSGVTFISSAIDDLIDWGKPNVPSADLYYGNPQYMPDYHLTPSGYSLLLGTALEQMGVSY
jgi:hypothetical protein